MEQVPAAWAGLRLTGEITGGNRTKVFSANLRGMPVVVRRSGRSQPSLDWEFNLLEHLAREGLVVPDVIPADDGRRAVRGWHVQRRISGAHPAGVDSGSVRDAVERVHAATLGWPQRPGSCAAASADLAVMPTDLRKAIASAWNRVVPEPSGVVHGDLNPGNVLIMEDGTCALIDWDEARVDDPGFDLWCFGVGKEWEQAALAWEIVTCWEVEPDYARSLVPDFLRAVEQSKP